MKCVIFGGGGFIGSAIADRLLQDGHSLRIFERPRVTPYRTFETHEHVEWMSGDFMSTNDISGAIDGMDVVFHLVSTTLPKSSNDDPIYDVQSNLVATLQMLHAMVVKDVKRIIFISSGGTVYGSPIKIPIDESHPTEPLVSYGITKLAIEKYLLLFERLHGIKPTILRVANPYGERQRVETAQGVLSIYLHMALLGQSVEIWGDGNITRDYIYISDVAEAFVKALNYSGSKRIFNISSGQGTSLNQLIDLIEQATNVPLHRQYVPGRSFDVPINILNNELAAAELGWVPKVTLMDGIFRTAAWLKTI